MTHAQCPGAVVPANAGTQRLARTPRGSRVRGNDGSHHAGGLHVVPADAGIQRRCFRRSRHARCIAAASGFSLLEVLVAFIIVALVVTALFRLFGGALGNASAADEWTRALLVAQSRLELAAAVQPLREASDAGSEDDGRIAWRTSVTPYVPPDANPDLERASESMPTRLYRVSVDVHFPGVAGRDRSLSLTTVKIGARNPG